LPLCFVENRGQVAPEVAYYVKGRNQTVFFTSQGVIFALRKGETRHAVKLAFVGSKPDVIPAGHDRREAVFSYFLGTDPENWTRGAPSYGRLVYQDLWPGIDLVYVAGRNQIKSTFVARPGADPSRIRIAYHGAERVFVDADGALHAETPAGEVVDEAPVAHQEVQGGRVAVPVRYRLDVERKPRHPTCSFVLGDFDPTKPLVLDPAYLVYCGYVGGPDQDAVVGVAVDGTGTAYLVGATQNDETTFPVRVGPGLKLQGYADIFVAKVNAQGTALLYCGYIGGPGFEEATGIAVDAKGNAYITGSAVQGYPLKNSPIPNPPSGTFVTKVNASGTDLAYSYGFIGGKYSTTGNAIAVDSSGNAYICGETLSDQMSFPVKVGE
jgi:hypothetical protein